MASHPCTWPMGCASGMEMEMVQRLAGPVMAPPQAEAEAFGILQHERHEVLPSQVPTGAPVLLLLLLRREVCERL